MPDNRFSTERPSEVVKEDPISEIEFKKFFSKCPFCGRKNDIKKEDIKKSLSRNPNDEVIFETLRHHERAKIGLLCCQCYEQFDSEKVSIHRLKLMMEALIEILNFDDNDLINIYERYSRIFEEPEFEAVMEKLMAKNSATPETTFDQYVRFIISELSDDDLDALLSILQRNEVNFDYLQDIYLEKVLKVT